MAQQNILLDKQRIISGYKLLQLLDYFRAEVIAAGWLYTDDGGWEYYIVTPIIEKKGIAWLVERFLKICSIIQLPEGISPLDVYFTGPDSSLFRDVGFISQGHTDNTDGIYKGEIPGNFACAKFYKLPTIKKSYLYRHAVEFKKGCFRFYIKNPLSNEKPLIKIVKRREVTDRYFNQQIKKMEKGEITPEMAYPS